MPPDSVDSFYHPLGKLRCRRARELPDVPLRTLRHLIVSDVGHSIDLYAEFSGTGGHYERFSDPKNHRILLTDLRQEKHPTNLRAIWTDPYSLDPSRKAAEVTRDIAKYSNKRPEP